jgi:Zn-dependent membrane protease YugP
MFYVILFAAMLAMVVFLPSLWVRRVMQKYQEPIDLYPHSGAELARKLIDDLGLDVGLEQGQPSQDHYDPTSRTVRLAPENYSGRSLTAVTVAAHEVGHAMQHAEGYRPLLLRTALARTAMLAEKVGAIALAAMPVVALLTRSPVSGVAMLALGIGSIAVGTLVHLITLPVEWNASFDRALPTLKGGEYLPEQHLPHARKILTAAALTYVAASLASLLSLYRWIAILRR